MQCKIYRCSKHDEMYLYLPADGRVEALPAGLLPRVGRLTLVMELELTPGRRLARADAGRVREDLAQRGYYLQLPPEFDNATRAGDDMTAR